ncbi:MAG TPA: hypothetical protein VJ843_02895 [Candidatus Saccharimonadales bacterium]|nr:hypothetical protein [Candidatus Saccharimonadales bacterium]
MTQHHRTRGHFLRNLGVSVALIVLTAVGLIHAQKPGTVTYANQCVTPAYADAHHAFSDRFGCFFVRSSLGEFSMPNIGMPSGGMMVACFLLLLMVVAAGLATRRQYGKQ